VPPVFVRRELGTQKAETNAGFKDSIFNTTKVRPRRIPP